MKTAEEILDLYIQEQNEYLDSDQKSVAVDAMKFYANQKLDEAANNLRQTAGQWNSDFYNERNKIMSLKDEL